MASVDNYEKLAYYKTKMDYYENKLKDIDGGVNPISYLASFIPSKDNTTELNSVKKDIIKTISTNDVLNYLDLLRKEKILDSKIELNNKIKEKPNDEQVKLQLQIDTYTKQIIYITEMLNIINKSIAEPLAQKKISLLTKEKNELNDKLISDQQKLEKLKQSKV